MPLWSLDYVCLSEQNIFYGAWNYFPKSMTSKTLNNMLLIFLSKSVLPSIDQQSVYIGVPVPRGYRRKRRRRRSSVLSHDEDAERRLRHDHPRHEHYDCDDRDRYDLEAGGLDHSEHNLTPDINRTSESLISSETVLKSFKLVICKCFLYYIIWWYIWLSRM